MVEWSRAFDAPVYLHADDREQVMRPDSRIEFWQGETRQLNPGITLIRCGGHFKGGTVLHWAGGAGGQGALLSGDILTVVPDRRYVSFMYIYPNLIPLPASRVIKIAEAIKPFAFERVYAAWLERVVRQDGKAAVARSAERYIAALKDSD